jgi:hypothetical protein
VPWNNANELIVAGDGQAYVAPSGTALPTNATGALNAAFVGLGYITEDGATVTVSPDIAEFMAWQSRSPVRREKTSVSVQIAFALMQWDEDSVPLAFGGGSVSGTAGNYRYDLPRDDSALDERALILDAVDGATHYRWVFPRGNVTEAVEAQYQRANPASLPITFSALAGAGGASPGYFLTDSAAFAVGS